MTRPHPSGSGAAHDYEVFLNFRGVDLRQGLIDNVRETMKAAGIRYFFDDESLRPGDKLQEILLRVERSHVYVVMLSVNYAQSKWCLRELARMVKCEEESNGDKVILPFFCGVTVENVKLREDSPGSYKAALGNLTAEAEELREWEEAMRKVARIKGPHMGTIGNVEFSQMIVKEARLRLKNRHLSYHQLGIGTDKEAHKLKEMLDIESGDVRFLVIHGEEGAGKTTLARVIFQQLSTRFQGSSFISDLREMSRHRHFEARLQRNMLVDICGDHKKSGDIRKDFREKKVLIVLDDVEEHHQIENLAGTSTWFGPGSRIIITTSNQELLSSQQGSSEECSVYPPSEVLGHEVQKMEFRQALQLFCRLAFWQDSPLPTFDELSRQIVDLCQGLPLILEIMGSLLRRERNKEIWREIRDRLRLSNTVQDKLMISYEKLENSIKGIFLDVACFFVNEKHTNPTYMWNKAEELDDLLMLSLVKIVDGDKLWMHDYLRDIGRRIVQSQLDPLKRCRFWEHKEALQVLKAKKGIQEVEALCFPYPVKPLRLTPEEFLNKPQLRLLKLYSVRFCGDFEDRLNQLRWLSWHYSPQDFEALHFASANLVILDLAQSQITHDWPAWNQIEVKNNLKVIDLTGCGNITKTPGFSGFMALERLVLEDCTRLAEIHTSIGQLTRLEYLNIKGCDSLEGLPKEICSLKTLTEIRMSKKNKGSFRLPNEIGSLESLTILEIVNVEMSVLPESIGKLKKLQCISLLGCSGFQNLPESVGELHSLAEVQISETTITGLPESIGDLKELKVIRIEQSSVRSLPQSIAKLEKLEELHAKHCQHLEGDIPDGIGKLSKLKILDLSHTSVGKLPETVGELSHLQKLQLQSCGALQNLTEFPKNLVSLGITVPVAAQVPNLFEGLTRLEKLELHVPHDSNCSPEFRFPDKLKSLLLSYNYSRCCLELPSKLSELVLENMKVDIRFLRVEKLSALKLNNCGLIHVNKASHKVVRLVSLFHIINELCPPKNLRVLQITQCKSRYILSGAVLDLSDLKCLKMLKISGWEGLVEVRGLGELESLEELHIHNCVSLVRLRGAISNSKRLKVFICQGNVKLKEIDGYTSLSDREDVKIHYTDLSLPSSDISESSGRPRQRVGSTSGENWRKEEARGISLHLDLVIIMVVLMLLGIWCR